MKPNYERNTFIGDKCISETELREALKRIEEQPIHGWKVGDIFHVPGGESVWRIQELIGKDSSQVLCLWDSYAQKVGDGHLYEWNLESNSSGMVKLVEESNV